MRPECSEAAGNTHQTYLPRRLRQSLIPILHQLLLYDYPLSSYIALEG